MMVQITFIYKSTFESDDGLITVSIYSTFLHPYTLAMLIMSV